MCANDFMSETQQIINVLMWSMGNNIFDTSLINLTGNILKTVGFALLVSYAEKYP